MNAMLDIILSVVYFQEIKYTCNEIRHGKENFIYKVCIHFRTTDFQNRWPNASKMKIIFVATMTEKIKVSICSSKR